MSITRSIPTTEDQEEKKSIHLVERMQVKPSSELSKICHKAKDLYNKANYFMRHYFFIICKSPELAKEWLKEVQKYFVSSPHEFDKIKSIVETYLKKIEEELSEKHDWRWYFHKDLQISYLQLEKMLKFSQEYKTMPAQSAQQTLKQIIADWESYCQKTIKYYENKKTLPPQEFKKRYPTEPKIPQYKKKDGETIAYFTNQQCHIKEGYLAFPRYTKSPKSPRWLPPLKTRFRGKFSHIEIVPKGAAYIIGIVYKKDIINYGLNPDRVAGIDLGIRNIITMVDNIGSVPIVVKGGVVKSINQYFNKKRAKLVSMKDKQGYKHWTRQLKKLSLNRYNRLHHAFHKLSKNIIEYCIDNNIGTLVIGYNINWKQKSNLGRITNQNFVNIPFWQLINKIKYKAELIGIKLILQEESYTSKCSFLDREKVCWHYRYEGKRPTRGLYIASDGRIINADVNGAFNIMRKAIPDIKGIEDVVLHPRCVNWY